MYNVEDTTVQEGSKMYCIICYIIGGVFLFSGGLKIFSASGFSTAIAQVVPTSVLGLLVLFGVPLAEMAIGSSIITKRYYRTSLFAAAVILVVFTVFIVVFSGKIGSNCGCFGDVISVSHHMAGLMKNAMLLAGVIYLINNHKLATSRPMYHS